MELYREDGKVQPPSGARERWEWKPRSVLTILKDSACAAENAAREVWPHA
jgi:hypothetical protein